MLYFELMYISLDSFVHMPAEHRTVTLPIVHDVHISYSPSSVGAFSLDISQYTIQYHVT